MRIEPKEGKPSVDEVNDWEVCWVFNSGETSWKVMTGEMVRTLMDKNPWPYTWWLPYEAIPHVGKDL